MKISTISVIALFLSGLLLTTCGIDLSGSPPFDNLIFTDQYSSISATDGRRWEIVFERPFDSNFAGVVRHTSRWHDATVPFMSHDILITTGDFTSQDRVDVSVFSHKFFYRYDGDPPQGSLNLLHVFPASKEVYEQLLKVNKWNHVSIRGREILKIDLYDSAGTYNGFFMDMGCNTILVTSVIVQSQGTPIP